MTLQWEFRREIVLLALRGHYQGTDTFSCHDGVPRWGLWYMGLLSDAGAANLHGKVRGTHLMPAAVHDFIDGHWCQTRAVQPEAFRNGFHNLQIWLIFKRHSPFCKNFPHQNACKDNAQEPEVREKWLLRTERTVSNSTVSSSSSGLCAIITQNEKGSI